jgi:hypothetical protein
MVVMRAVDNYVTKSCPVKPSTLRVRRNRERRREHLRLLTVEIPEPVIEDAIARDLLKPEESAQAWAVIESVYAAQLSERALNWLTSNGVITREQRTNTVAILRCISDWLEHFPLLASFCGESTPRCSRRALAESRYRLRA